MSRDNLRESWESLELASKYVAKVAGAAGLARECVAKLAGAAGLARESERLQSRLHTGMGDNDAEELCHCFLVGWIGDANLGEARRELEHGCEELERRFKVGVGRFTFVPVQSVRRGKAQPLEHCRQIGTSNQEQRGSS